MKHGHKHHTQHDRERDAAPQPAASQPDTGQQAGESPEETALAPEAIAELQAKAAERDKWHTEFLYKAAELENMRKRAAKERQELIRYSGQDIFAQLLEVVDNFGRAVDGSLGGRGRGRRSPAGSSAALRRAGSGSVRGAS